MIIQNGSHLQQNKIFPKKATMAVRDEMSKFQMPISSQNIENQFLQDDKKPKKSSRYFMALIYAFDFTRLLENTLHFVGVSCVTSCKYCSVVLIVITCI